MVWQWFTWAKSPYPLIGTLIFFNVTTTVKMHFFLKFLLDAMPLELYHVPWWVRELYKQSPLLKKRFALEALKPGAERRTTELGARMGIQQDDKHRGP